MKKIIFTFLVLLTAICGYSQTTYYWVGGVGPVSFTANSNWNTAQNGTGTTRSASAATDVLIINGTNIGGTVPTTGTVTATITSTSLGQLRLTGNANVVFLRPTGGGGTGTMTINGGTGEDLVVDAGSALTLSSPTADGSVVIALVAGATGSISGTINISNTAQHRITNQTTGGLVFNSGSTMTSNLTGASTSAPFGTNSQSVEKGVTFLAGSNLIYLGGYSPVGNNSTFSAVDMRPGSNYYHRATNAAQGVFATGKAYGNMFIENGATFACDGPLYRIGNLNIAAGCTFTTHSSGQTAILGDFIVNGTYTVGAGSNALVLGGTGTQNISGTGTITAPAITVGDNSTVVLNRDLSVATSLNVYGNINFNNFQVSGAGTFASRVANSNVTLTGNLVVGSYQITGATGIAGTINGLTITGAGIPANTTVVGSSPANATINLSQPITAAGTGVSLNFASEAATMITSHVNGMDTLTGSVIVVGTKTFQTGTNYIINGATTKPFGISTGSTNTYINADFVEINAPVTVNRGMEIYNHLTVNGKITLRPLDTVRIKGGAVINGTFNASNYIATTANPATGEMSILTYEGMAAATLLPIGSPANYLPLSLTPTVSSTFNTAVFEGITSQGTVNGTPLTPVQKQSVVDAVWKIDRSIGSGAVGMQISWVTGLEGSTFTTLPNTDIGVIYNTGSSYTLPAGTGDNTANTATTSISSFGAYSAGAVPSTQPFVFNPIAPKTYGNPDFTGGATSLNTTKPIIYSSSDPLVATIVSGSIHITGTGTVDITAEQESDGFYPAASVTRTLIVNKATLTITADNKTKFFNEAMPALTFGYSGFVYGETPAVLLTPVNISTTATQSSPVGTYPIVVNNATAANYNIVFVNGTLTINPQQSQTITFNVLPTKTYGNADFAIGATSTNNTIPLTYSSSNPAVATIVGSNIHIVGAGTSNITVSQAGNIGYTPATPVTRTLTVNKANLAIRVRDTVKTQGQPNPDFTITYTGFVLGETPANLLTPVQVVTSATTTSAPGYYPLTLTGATSNNYNITYTNGRLTILPASGTDLQYINVFMSATNTMSVRVYTPQPKLADIVVFNMAGQPLARKNIFMPAGFITHTIDVSQFPSGTYMVLVQGVGVDLRKSIVIVK